jgi:hypothetical protein
MNRNLLLGGLVLLLLCGCAGRQAARAPPAPQPSVNQPGLQIGDSDIAPVPEQNESDILSVEDVVPPDNGSGTAMDGSNASGALNGTGAMNGTNLSSALPDDSDLSLANSTNEDLISQEDVVEPG